MRQEDRQAFWADVRHDYATLWPQIRDSWREMREEWREMTAERRQYRQLTHRMWQRVTGKPGAVSGQTASRRSGIRERQPARR